MAKNATLVFGFADGLPRVFEGLPLPPGHIYLSDAVSSDILGRLAGGGPKGRETGAVDSMGGLSDREIEVLRLIGGALKTGDLARAAFGLSTPGAGRRCLR